MVMIDSSGQNLLCKSSQSNSCIVTYMEKNTDGEGELVLGDNRILTPVDFAFIDTIGDLNRVELGTFSCVSILTCTYNQSK